MILRVCLCSPFSVLLGVNGVASCRVRMMRGFLMMSGLMVLGSFGMMSSSVGVVL
jgi:hypothetical protein